MAEEPGTSKMSSSRHGKGGSTGSPKVFEANISVGLDEHNPLTGAVDGELPSMVLPKPSSERVVGHKGFGESFPYNPHGVLASHGLVPPVEQDDRDLDPQAVLLIEIRETLELTRCRGRRRHHHRRSPTHHELGRH